MSIDQSNIHKPLFAVSIILFFIGFTNLFGPKVTGLGKGLGAVFFILFFICNLLKGEKTDDELRGDPSQIAPKSKKRSASRDLNAVHA